MIFEFLSPFIFLELFFFMSMAFGRGAKTVIATLIVTTTLAHHRKRCEHDQYVLKRRMSTVSGEQYCESIVEAIGTSVFQ